MNWKIVLCLMVSFALFMSSSYTMLIPFLPIYLDEALHATKQTLPMWSGLTFAISFGISAIAAPIWGKISDKMGKKPMIIRSSLLIAITYCLEGIVQTPFQLFLARAFQGFAAGLWPACLVLLSAYTPKKKLGFAMGWMQSANITGAIIGPLLGGFLAMSFGMRNSFFISATVLFSICLITIFVIKEPPKEEVVVETKDTQSTYLDLLKNKNVLILLMVALIANFVLLQIQPIVALYVKTLANSDNKDTMFLSGLILSLGGIAGALSAPLWGRSGQKYGFFRTLTLALMSAGLVMALQGLPNSLILFGLIQFICGLGFSGIFPSANAILVLFTPASSRGIGFGLLFSAQMIGGTIGPLLSSAIVTFTSFGVVYLISGSILLLTGILLIVAAPHDFKQKANQTALKV